MIRLVRAYLVKGRRLKAYTILIDRLWPRGVKKTDLNADEWLKEVAPSISLRKWFNHDPEKWVAFKKKYTEELKKKGDVLKTMKSLEKEYGTIILLFAAKDEDHNHALVLKELLDKL